MKAKLIKTGNEFLLQSEDGETLGITSGIKDGSKLSIKNCEAIANGYDLDELGTEAYKKHNIDNLSLHEEIQRSGAFLVGHKEGFQKALEILGDKKFSEEDVIKAMNQFSNTMKSVEKIFKSLQQTEWEVEICCYLGNGDKESDSFKDTFVTNTGIPKLDSDGCLIFKRI